MRAYQLRKRINSGWVAVDRITRNLSKTGRHKGLELIRTQIPLIAANGMTITKSQGSSLPQVVVSVKKSAHRVRKLSRPLLYVACSRAMSLEGLYIDGPFEPPSAPGPNDDVTKEMERLRAIPYQYSIQFLQDFGDEYEKLYFHNVQSFFAHHKDVEADRCAMASNIMAFVEPHLLSTDQVPIRDFEALTRVNCSQNRNSEGILLLQRSGELSQIYVNCLNKLIEELRGSFRE